MKTRKSCLKGAKYRVDVGLEAVLKAKVCKGQGLQEAPLPALTMRLLTPPAPASSLPPWITPPPPDFAARGDEHVDMYVGAYVSLSADGLWVLPSPHTPSPPTSTFSSSSLHWQELQALLSQP